MSEITAEMLKVIAEGMGYEASYGNLIPEAVFITTSEDGRTTLYNPLTNAEQMVEIMHRMQMDTSFNEETQQWGTYWKKGGGWIMGDTINEAVVLAAYEYFK